MGSVLVVWIQKVNLSALKIASKIKLVLASGRWYPNEMVLVWCTSALAMEQTTPSPSSHPHPLSYLCNCLKQLVCISSSYWDEHGDWYRGVDAHGKWYWCGVHLHWQWDKQTPPPPPPHTPTRYLTSVMVLSSLSALAAATGMNMGTGIGVLMPTGNGTGVVYICIGNGM